MPAERVEADAVQEVDRSRVLRVDRHRRHPGAVHPHVRRAGVQDPDRIDGEQPAHRRSSAGQQVRVRPDRVAGSSARCCRSARSSAATSSSSSIPEEPERDFIKRVIGLPGETVEVREKKVYINGKPLDEPYVHFLEPAGGAVGVPRGDVVRRARALRPGDRAAEPVLRDGRQPRQLAGQPLLGLPAARVHQGQGAASSTGRTKRGARTIRRKAPAATSKGLGSVFVAFLHAHALGPDVPPDHDRRMLKLLDQAGGGRADRQRGVPRRHRVSSRTIGSATPSRRRAQFGADRSTSRDPPPRSSSWRRNTTCRSTEDGFTIRRTDEQPYASSTAATPRGVDLLPGYQYPWPFTVHVDVFTVKTPRPD